MSVTQGTPPAIQGYEANGGAESANPVINPIKIAGRTSSGVTTTIQTNAAGAVLTSGGNANGTTSTGFATRIGGIGIDGTGNSYDIGANSANQGLINTEGLKKTYSLGGLITPVATATDILNLAWVSGTVKLLHVQITIVGTATGINDVLLIKRSTANTGGTATTPTPVPHLSTDGAAAAVLSQYSANPTTGTAVGTLRASKVGSAVADTVQVITWDFTRLNDRAPTLVSALQSLSVNLNGDALVAGEVIAYSIMWSEE